MYRAVSYWLLLLVGWVAVSWLTVRNRQADRAAAAARAAPAGPSLDMNPPAPASA
jgi:hypothetical protein